MAGYLYVELLTWSYSCELIWGLKNKKFPIVRKSREGFVFNKLNQVLGPWIKCFSYYFTKQMFIEAFKVIANGNVIGSEEKERNASLKAIKPPECSKYYYLMIGLQTTTATYASVIIFIWITVSFQRRWVALWLDCNVFWVTVLIRLLLFTNWCGEMLIRLIFSSIFSFIFQTDFIS